MDDGHFLNAYRAVAYLRGDWCCGTDEVVLIGVAEGTVHILEWNDELLST